MRIIAGTAGGIHLEVPKTGVRPTMDQVKGAIFSSLADAIPGAVVLDLFAGSGGLGIEALSRGAASATFVEQNRQALDCIRKNLTKARLTANVVPRDVYQFLASTDLQFDFVFADPPYSHEPNHPDHAALLLKNKHLPAVLKPNGLFILEKIPKTDLPELGSWEVIREKRYGNTELVYLRHKPQP